MATTENLYTGDGSTVLYSFTFPYIQEAHVKVSLDGVDTTEYTLANATTVQMNVAPANGVLIRVYRDTPADALEATFYPGSSIRAQDLNDNFTQSLYVLQEVDNNALQTDSDALVTGDWTFTNSVSVPQPIDPADIATKQYVDSLAINGVSDGDKGDITVSGGGLVWTLNDTYLTPADIGVTVQGYDATLLNDADIGVTVQGYDADTAKLDVAQTFTAQQTFGELKETVYTLGTTGSIALDPANGSVQTSVLTGDVTFTDSFEAGQSIVLMLENGASHTVTWPTITWATGSGNTAPDLTAKDVVVLWKVGSTLYGAYTGSYV